MEETLVKSKERVRKLGEVFTPAALVNEMLDHLPQDLFTDPEKTFIDPACGNGNFLVEVIRRKIAGGSTPLQALETTYGVDIMEDNVQEARQRMLDAAGSPSGGEQVVTHRIRCANTLEVDLDELFA